jgi:Yip1 domain
MPSPKKTAHNHPENRMDLVSRVKGILLNPKNEWTTIDTEPTTVGSLYTGYIIPLAAIPAVCSFIGSTMIGNSVTGKVGMSTALTIAAVSFALSLAVLYVIALIIDALAPSFGGQKSQIQALKVVAYSSTAAWVAGVFTLVPGIGGLVGLVGLVYSLYLLYMGLPILMKAPQDKAMGYTVVVIVAWIVMYVVVGMIVLSVVGTGVMLGR